MKCPTCGDAAKLMHHDGRDVRAIHKAMNVQPRKRECLRGHQFVTYEVDEGELLRLRRLAFLANLAGAQA